MKGKSKMDKQEQFFTGKYGGFTQYEAPIEKVFACADAIKCVSAQCNYEIADYLVKCLTEKYALYCCDKRIALTDQYETYRMGAKWFRENVAVKLDTDIRNYLIYGHK